MAFKRIIEIAVGSAPIGGASTVGILISELNVEFEVTRSINFSDNSCDITIYNAHASTAEELLVEGNNLVLKAGYEDEGEAVIFIGNIVSSITQRDGKERTTIIKAGGIQKADRRLAYVTVELSFAALSPIIQVITDIGNALGLVVFGADNVSGIILPNGYVYAGTAKKALKYCRKILKSNNVGLYIDNNEIIVYRLGVQDSRFRSVYLDKDSGLINAYIVNENYRVGDTIENVPRVKFVSILNPLIQPNGLITIKNDRINGTYRVEKIQFKGDNFGGEFICEGESVL